MIQDADCTVLLGDALEQLATLPSESVQCIVTSPPFWALRDYGTGRWEGGDTECTHPPTGSPQRDTPGGGLGARASAERGEQGYATAGARPQLATCSHCGARRVDNQIGLEASPEAWCDRLVAVFREARRVLRRDGTLWLEVGDTYNNLPSYGRGQSADDSRAKARTTGGSPNRTLIAGLKPKDLVGAPWLLAFALRADGWYLRSEIIWGRPNPMPESVRDRPTKAHSQVFLLSKSPRYFYDADAIREPAANDPRAGGRQRALAKGDDRYAQGSFNGATEEHEQRSRNLNASKRRTVREGVDVKGGGQGTGEISFPVDSANARSVWSIPTQPTPFAHFATFPEELVLRCIRAGTSERGACPECGAPWQRETERGFTPHQETWNVRAGGGDDHAATGVKASGHMPGTPNVRTVGWAPPGCTCETVLDPVPCVVLDPFMGSGTTALVARRLGRRAVGIELNPEYLLIAAERLSQQSLFA